MGLNEPPRTEAEIEKAQLKEVLRIADGDIHKIRDGLSIVLRSEQDKARKIYLWNKYDTAARRRIHDAERAKIEKDEESATTKPTLEERAHEAALENAKFGKEVDGDFLPPD